MLGGIRSGKSTFAEALLVQAERVRYVATAAVDEADGSFAERIEAHRFRRPASWETVETGGDPDRLIEAINSADSALLVDDLGGWAAGLLGRKDAGEFIARLTEAIERSEADVVLVSPEVGLSVVPPTEVGVEFADVVGQLNQAVANACDSVALVVAGQPTWLKQAAPRAEPVEPTPARQTAVDPTPVVQPSPEPEPLPVATGTAAPVAAAGTDALTEQTTALPVLETGLTVIAPGMNLPIHDDESRTEARKHLSKLDVAGAGLGALAGSVVFAAGTQSKSVPKAWEQPHMLLFHGSHQGDISAGSSVSGAARIAREADGGEGAVGLLATWNGVRLKVVEAQAADDVAYGRAASPEQVDAMLTEGMRLADEAVDNGADLLIIGSCGAGADAAGAALVARLTGAEIATLLARIVGPDGSIDDASWMLRCAAIRDALHRVRNLDLMAKTLLSELGGPDFAMAAGVVLGATARRTAVLMDGPFATAAALVARDLGSQSRLWCTLPDHSGHPTTRAAADVLGLTPFLDLKVDLGEGAVSLLALPLLRAGLHLSTALETKPAVIGIDQPR